MGEEALSGGLKVTYVPTTDYYGAYFDYLRRRPSSKPWIVVCLLPVVFGIAAGYELARNPQAGGGPRTALGVALVCFVIFSVIAIATVFDRHHGRRVARERFKAQKFAAYFFLPKAFEASRDGVRLSDDISTTSSLWSGIEKIDATDKAIYVNGAPFNIIVPAHAFSSEAKFTEGINQLRSWLDTYDRAAGREAVTPVENR
jgi:hypothetical protein